MAITSVPASIGFTVRYLTAVFSSSTYISSQEPYSFQHWIAYKVDEIENLMLGYILSTGFYDECKRRYNVKLWKTFTDCFNCLPIAAIIDEKIFCCHGGLSPDLQGMEQIRRIMRPTDVPDTGLLCDLLWSDPDKDVQVSLYFFSKF